MHSADDTAALLLAIFLPSSGRLRIDSAAPRQLLLPAQRRRATLPSMNGLGAFFIIIVAAVLLALLGLALVRRTVPLDRLARHTDVAGYVYAVIGVIYAVILAQVVIAAWQEYQDARAVADNEANAVLNLARLAQVWPTEDRQRVEDALSAYAQHVVEIEWPTWRMISSMSHCKRPSSTSSGKQSTKPACGRKILILSTPRHFSSSTSWTGQAQPDAYW